MTKKEFLAFHRATCEHMIRVTEQKNSDYTGSNDDPFANFKLVEIFGVSTVSRGFFTRMTDKLARVASFIKQGTLQVKDETVEDTLIDLANYCILFAGYLRSIRTAPRPGAPQPVTQVGNVAMQLNPEHCQ